MTSIPRPQETVRPSARGAAHRRDVKDQIVLIALALGGGLTLAGVLLMATREFADLVPLLALVPIGTAALVWMVRTLAEPEDRDLVTRAVIAGLLLRLGLALLNHYLVPVWFFAPDQATYDSVGYRLLLYHRGQASLPWQLQGTTEVGYFYWNSLLFAVFGHAPVAPRIWNAFVGTASGVLAYRLAGELAGREPARISLLLCMFFPSLVLWSTLNLRDPAVLLVTLLLFLAVARLRTKPAALPLFAILLCLGLLLLIRDYIAVMVVFGLVGSSAISRRRGLALNLVVGAILFGLAVLAYRQFGLGAQWVESASFETISQQRANLATGGSAFRPGADVSTPLRGLQFLPLGIAFFLFSPFPWQIGSALTLMTLPEQIVWYSLIPAVIGGGRYLLRERYHVFGPIMVFLAMTTSVYALVEGNAGTAYRHRAQVLVFILIMASVGLTLRQERRKRQGKRVAP